MYSGYCYGGMREGVAVTAQWLRSREMQRRLPAGWDTAVEAAGWGL